MFDVKINSTHLQETLKQLLVLYETALPGDRSGGDSAGEATQEYQVVLTLTALE